MPQHYQVTALFSRTWEIVGADEINDAEARRLVRKFESTGHAVHVHLLTQTGSVLIYETGNKVLPL